MVVRLSDIYQFNNSELQLDERDLDGKHGLGDEDEEEFGRI